MATPTDILVRLAPQSLAAALEELADLTRRQRAGERELHVPRATLYYPGGVVVEGVVVAFQVQTGHVVVLPLARSNDTDVVYAETRQLVALRVHHTPQSLQQTLHQRQSTGIIEAEGSLRPTVQAPSNLELRRMVPAVQAAWQAAGYSATVEANWDSLPLSDNARARWAQLLSDLEKIVAQLLADPLGADALRAVRVYRLAVGPSPEVKLSAGAVTLQVGTVGDDLLTFSRTELQKALERVL